MKGQSTQEMHCPHMEGCKSVMLKLRHVGHIRPLELISSTGHNVFFFSLICFGNVCGSRQRLGTNDVDDSAPSLYRNKQVTVLD